MAWTRIVTKPRAFVYLSAGIHGDEPAGPAALLELMRNGFFQQFPDVCWATCPALNPEGLQAGRRENLGGVDLNRDYRLFAAAEVVGHVAWLAKIERHPDLFISLHEDWESSGFYFYEINHGPDVPTRAGKILAAVAPWFGVETSRHIDGHETRQPGWIFHPPEADEPDGWPEAIYLSHLGCPLSFTFETPSRAEFQARVAAHQAAVNAACIAVLSQDESKKPPQLPRTAF